MKKLFKRPILKTNKKLIGAGLVLLIIVTVGLVVLFKDSVGAYIKQIGGLVKDTENLNFHLTTPIIVVLILSATLLISYYLMRSTYQYTGMGSKWKRGFCFVFYWIGNIYVAALEIIMYGLIFAYGLTATLPAGRETNESAIAFLMMPVIWGIIIMVILNLLVTLILWWLFSREYGGLLLLEELKWNRDIIDIVATLLFIFAILGTLATVVIDNYKFTDDESKFLFVVLIFTIALYVLKVIKNFTITFLETK